MGIPESQLETWSHQGSIIQSSSTYATIKNALESPGSPYASKSFKVFLQGSYGNDTNIYSESDVDVVMRLDSTFLPDLTLLPQAQQLAFQGAYTNAEYPLTQFKSDVLAQLTDKFGAAITSGTKALKIAASGSRRSADVVVSAQYRRYYRFISLSDKRLDEGIWFFQTNAQVVVNFPIQHSQNCTRKHQATNSWFKPMVRILKNARTKLMDEGLLGSGVAPSYFIEGLLYNVPDVKFGISFEDTFVNAVNWISDADRSKFLCANEQHSLLTGDPNVTWSPTKCDEFLNALTELWKQW